MKPKQQPSKPAAPMTPNERREHDRKRFNERLEAEKKRRRK